MARHFLKQRPDLGSWRERSQVWLSTHGQTRRLLGAIWRVFYSHLCFSLLWSTRQNLEAACWLAVFSRSFVWSGLLVVTHAACDRNSFFPHTSSTGKGGSLAACERRLQRPRADHHSPRRVKPDGCGLALQGTTKKNEPGDNMMSPPPKCSKAALRSGQAVLATRFLCQHILS